MAESHIRIDEGIKRGPRNPHKAPPRRLDTATGAIPSTLTPEAVIERYLTESTTSQIAQSYGVSRKTLVRWLVEQRPKEWKQVQVIRALCRKDDGDEGLEVACDALSLARAREQLKSAQWDLERLDHTNYGMKQEVTVKNEEHITLVLEGDVQALIEKIRPKNILEGVASQVSCTAIEPVLPLIPDNTNPT
mgnify:CR=1 FL=1